MGADLIGAILIGPKKLRVQDRQHSIKFMEQVKQECDRYIKIVRDNSSSLEEEEKVIGHRDFSRLKKILERVMAIEGQDDFADAAESVSGLFESYSPEKLMAEFVCIWNGGYRDVMERSLSKTQKIVVTGIMSWGDGFEEGSAGWMITRMDWFGLFKILGIS